MWMMDDQSAVDSSSGLAIPCLLCSLTSTHLFLEFIARYAQTAHRQCRIVAFSGLQVESWNACGRMMEELGVSVKSNKSADPLQRYFCSPNQ